MRRVVRLDNAIRPHGPCAVGDCRRELRETGELRSQRGQGDCPSPGQTANPRGWPSGIGCPVIASITGATAVLAVTEPTLSGEHDLERVLMLARHFGMTAAVCVNKWDINADATQRIERRAVALGAVIVGRIPYDRAVTDAQVQGKTVVEHGDGPAARGIRQTWEKLWQTMV